MISVRVNNVFNFYEYLHVTEENEDIKIVAIDVLFTF